ncbi:putative RDD family membrane protein YckC [Paenibacillus mucilaginosus]|uniref:RDD family protein n=1 Tax=Paenibacillus mucilaginosus TaxID=61624 RepID=UPI003D20BFEA
MYEHDSWYYKNKQEEAGPLTLEEIQALIRSGAIFRTTLLRPQSVEEWRPGESWSALEWEESDGRTVRPWMRYWARSLDLLLWTTMLEALLAALPVSVPLPAPKFLLPVLFALLWLPVESLLLSTWGTTPGKLLFGVKVRRTDSGKAQLTQALRRSMLLLWRGLGLEIPVISLLTMLNAHHELHRHGQTSWDRDTGLQVQYRSRSWIDTLLVLVPIALLFYL